MGSTIPALAVAGLLAASPAGAQVVVNAASGKVSIRASGQPASSLLDQLAQKTGMSIEYEKNPPRQGVTLTLEDRTPAQAVVAILEGLNVPYALSLTPDGLQVQTLVIADATPPPKGAMPRVGRAPREAAVAPPPDEPPDVPPQEPAPDANTGEVTLEAPPADAPQQRRGMPAPPPVTLPSAFPSSPFGAGAAAPVAPAAKEEPAPEAAPQPPQAEKEPNV